MEKMKLIKIEVAFALPDKQKIIPLEVTKNISIETAIHQSGILKLFPMIDLASHKVGVFGKIKKLSDGVVDGDRIEIYRPLTIDPKEARRLRDKNKK